MKTLLLLTSLLMLTSCGDLVPMSDAEGEAYKACLEKGYIPRFYIQPNSRDLRCDPPKPKC